MNNNIRIRVAELSDKTRIENLLRQINLRSDDILATNTKYWVAEIEDHIFVGCAGLEFGAEAVLLRSVVVSPNYRSEGVGCSLVKRRKALQKRWVTKLFFCLV